MASLRSCHLPVRIGLIFDLGTQLQYFAVMIFYNKVLVNIKNISIFVLKYLACLRQTKISGI